ncbi:MAG: ribosome biogenesis GTPase Der [Planctomycetaceae bacterium]|nr:ribosome biogenesis GTPase Der [Planctomycetaceae bacterium]MCA9031801.1 ribosome biogenesis GTPase Der [Planctomycetaceae bacterium]MCB9954193.1 ribosome biogenesis GTPase Der [Planctomycetaceae bacterium]
MSIPKVAIVGRPNVGKSSILNWQAGKFVSVVDPTAGVTRDRVTYLMHHKERYFEFVDTGGIGIVDSDDLSDDVERQIQFALDEAQLILFVVDGSSPPTSLDRIVADKLRRMETPKVLVINKCDSPKTDMEIHEYYGFGGDLLVQTSVKANRGKTELLDAILEMLPPADETESTSGGVLSEEPELKLAIVGRRNVGKSTFINALADTDRMIVSEVAGTTRDSVDLRFELDGKSFVAIDTPGVRKRKSLANDIEFYGLVRAQKSIRRANVVFMFFDATNPISRVDKKLVEEIQERDKACVFVVNKWDLALERGMTNEKWADYLFSEFASLRHVPVAFITAAEQRNIKPLVNLAQAIYKQAMTRVGTGVLNRLLQAAMRKNPPKGKPSRRGRAYFATQVATEPPTIVVKCNDPDLFDPAWKRYLLGVFRDALPFKEVPIRLYMRGKGERDMDEFPQD